MSTDGFTIKTADGRALRFEPAALDVEVVDVWPPGRLSQAEKDAYDALATAGRIRPVRVDRDGAGRGDVRYMAGHPGAVDPGGAAGSEVSGTADGFDGGGRVKLSDLDQRVIVPVVDETRGGIRYEMQISVGELLGKVLEDFEPAVVDAVPVAWLKSKRKEALHEGMRPDEVEAVEMVLWMWQKEQEGK